MADGDRARGRGGRGRSRGTPSAESLRSGEGAPPGAGHGRGTAPPPSAWGRPQQQQAPAPKPQGPPAQQQQQRPPATARGKQAAMQQAAPQPTTPRSEAGLAPGVPEMTGAFRGMQIAASASASGGAERQAAQRRGAMRGRKEIGPPLYTKPDNVTDKRGSGGQTIRVMSNHFKLIKTTDWSLYQYRVDFAPEEDRTVFRKGLLRAHKDTIGDTYMFDGSMLFTIRRLVMNNDQLELFSTRESDQERIRITIKFASELALGDFQYIQLFNIILRNCIGSLDFQLVGREYFDPKGKVDLSNYKLEIWPGYVTSILQYEHNIMLNIDVSHKVLRRDTVLDLLNECRNRSGGDDWEKKFAAAILGMVVFTHYNNKPYRVDDVDFQSTPHSTFKKGNDDVKYVDYYRDRYNLNIRDMRQPLLVSRPKAKDLRGGRDQNVVLIPELCNMTGLSNEMRSNFHLMKAVADHTRIPPNNRIKSYYDFLTRLNRNQVAKQKLDQWNMKLSDRLEEFPARRLDPETLILGNQKEISYDDTGDWTKNLRFSSMLASIRLTEWVVIAPAQLSNRGGQGAVDNFLSELKKAANSLKFELGPPNKMISDSDKPSGYHLAIEKAMSRGQMQLVMCIVPNNRTDIYSAVKKKCCVDRPVASQVITVKTLNHKNLLSVATKIIIQMNCKLGGAPWYIPLPFRANDKPDPSMIVGFDVCHDTNIKGKSFGAVVASLDYFFTKFYSAVSQHSFGEELSNEIATHILHAVIRFRELNGKLPSRIILYRDGVGESNIPFVLEHEVKMIQERLAKTFPGFQIKLVVIIVSKRINSRIFHNGQNPKPGTIVDDVITQPERFDFFIVSQSVRQGTVTPTSYNVIFDSLKLKPEIYQKLTYKMTHLYYNCSATVRVPAQVQYAHKLAFLVGQAIHQAPSTDLNGYLYFL